MSDKDEILTDSTGTVFGLQEMVHELWLDFKERRRIAVCEAPRETPAPAVEECAGCRYWLERGADTAGDILGSCRRNPPQVYRDDYGDRFPLTWPHDWCGEWKA